MTAVSAGSADAPSADLSGWVDHRFGVRLRTTSSPVGLRIENVVGLALRRNPRRAHLLVSTVLGKHVPADPHLILATGRLLGELAARCLEPHRDTSAGPGAEGVEWSALAGAAVLGDPALLLGALDRAVAARAPGPALVLGFAETATALGHLVADQLLAAGYLHSTRRRVPGVAVAATFQEGHSHATDHLLLPAPATVLRLPGPMVLVDDELSTGDTAMGTIRAVHAAQPRRHYVIAALIDLRSAADEQRMDDLAGRLGCRIDVVSLVRGAVVLPDGLLDAVNDYARMLPPAAPSAPAAVAVSSFSPVLTLPWPPGVPDGGRHGFAAQDRTAFASAVAEAGQVLVAAVERRLADTGGRRVLVVGTEEFLYVPLRLAALLAAAGLQVRFHSTTRSPVLPVDAAGYPVRRAVTFDDPEGDRTAARFLYNAPAWSDSAPRSSAGTPTADEVDLVVVLTDAAGNTTALRQPGGLLDALQRNGCAVLVGALVGPPAGSLPAPLTGPTFGSYAPAEVRWLLTDLSAVALEGDVQTREAAIQAGRAHYAESLPIEFQPDGRYQQLFHDVLRGSARRLALAVGRVTELVLQERGHDIVLASLARAGTPIGALMRRWIRFRHAEDVAHYALSIVRGRGIDTVALAYLASHHEPRQVVFVDGWTGKGAIAVELSAALRQARAEHGMDFDDDLAVLADPGRCVRTFGTRDDFLIASACLNSTVSGLVSRTVLNDRYVRPGQFHGAKYYRELVDGDVSNVLLDTVTAAFPLVLDEVVGGLAELAGSDRTPTFSGWAAIEKIRLEYGIESVNFVKPGVGETTRVLLRRVPWRILVNAPDNPDHHHLRVLAAQRDVPIEVRPDLPYSCVGLIRRLSGSEVGEG